MCVNSLNIKEMCARKAAFNLVVLDFCINTHTHTHTHTISLYYIKKVQQGFFSVVNELQAIITLWLDLLFSFLCQKQSLKYNHL